MALHAQAEVEPKVKNHRPIRLRSEAEKPLVGRSNLTQDQLKNAPATFGDALNALTTLPGVMRTDTLFGTLIIRGQPDSAHRYFVDGMPITRPMHFGGLHSIINNDIVKDVDLYASAAPAKYSGVTGAVLEFNTIDSVEDFGGEVDIGLVSANALIKKPAFGNGGYWIASGRIGYLPLVIPPIYEAITGRELFALPQYYDYQLKGKFFLDEMQKHSITLLSVGAYDTVKVVGRATQGEANLLQVSSFDFGLGTNATFFSNATGAYYGYNPSPRLSNRLLLYNTYAADSFQANAAGTGRQSFPNMTGIKNDLQLTWLDTARLRTGAEYVAFQYQNSGYYEEFIRSESWPFLAEQRVDYAHHITTHSFNSYAENDFRIDRLTVTPGVRADIVAGLHHLAIGPRLRVSYKLTDTTQIESAGGQYLAYAQTNDPLIDYYAYDATKLMQTRSLRPEEAIHRSLALSQTFLPWKFKIEGFYNNFYRGVTTRGDSFVSGTERKNIGCEFSVEKQSGDESKQGFTGWGSYAIARSEQHEHVSAYDQTHVFKVVVGYLSGIHATSLRSEVFSGFAYYPITGLNERGFILQDSTASARYPFAHRISIRYSQERQYSWGSFKWYIEVINLTNHAPHNTQYYDFSKPYEPGVNPYTAASEPKIPILPNLGIEIRF